jgi:hypothetical protein
MASYDKEFENVNYNTDGSLDLNSGPVYATINNTVRFYPHIVKRDEEMRLDKICERLWKDASLVADLTRINGIVNVFSIKENDIIYYCRREDIDGTKEIITISEDIKKLYSVNLYGQKVPIRPKISVSSQITDIDRLAQQQNTIVNKGTRIEGDNLLMG